MIYRFLAVIFDGCVLVLTPGPHGLRKLEVSGLADPRFLCFDEG